jgi:hypothetical protein
MIISINLLHRSDEHYFSLRLHVKNSDSTVAVIDPEMTEHAARWTGTYGGMSHDLRSNADARQCRFKQLLFFGGIHLPDAHPPAVNSNYQLINDKFHGQETIIMVLILICT